MIRFLILLFASTFSLSALANSPKLTIEEYIETWKEVAVEQMLLHQIPASITLSQGILESGFGNSVLATRANNHFGIKCHDWKGKKFHQDDDAKNECFRKYRDAAESYEDHSEFLTSRSRYASLFDLEITDYKGWAHGLKAAGYATNPKYAKRLIDLIQRYDLDQFDLYGQDYIAQNTKPNKPSTKPAINLKPSSNKGNANSVKAFVSKHDVYVDNNRTKYVIAGEHDTFYQISKEFGLNLRQLNKYNNFPPTQDILYAGDIVYIMKKRKKPNTDLSQIRIKGNQNLWSISQEYGIQLKSLLAKNNFDSPNVPLTEGDVINLK